MRCDIRIKLDLPDDVKLIEASDQQLASAMNAEIEDFGKWFVALDNQPLIGPERAILRTFLAWKLRYAEGRADPKD